MNRKCTGSDFDDIFEIINDGAGAYKAIIPDDQWHDPYMPRTELQQQIDAGVEFWSYQEGDVLVGVMGIQNIKEMTSPIMMKM
ncbi:MAG: hypothetical protein ACE5IR_04725 [bacterium]